MTITLSFGPWMYTAAAFLVGLALMASDRPVGSFLPMPGGRGICGLLLWVSIPFMWLGVWIGR